MNTLTFGQISKFYMLLSSALQTKISREYSFVNEKELELYLKVLTLFRNVCAHNERLYNFRTHIDFPDTILHSKLKIPQKGQQYIMGKRDLFGVIIALRYLLTDHEFSNLKFSLIDSIKLFIEQNNKISLHTLHTMMGFPENWESITDYRL